MLPIDKLYSIRATTPKSDDGNYTTQTLIIVSIVTISVASIITLGRLVIRWRFDGHLHLEDVFIFISYIINVIFTIIQLLTRQRELAFALLFTHLAIYPFAMFATKISILIFIRRVIPTPGMQMVIHWTIGFLTVWLVAVVMVFFFFCSPPQAVFSLTARLSGAKCLPFPVVFRALSAIHITVVLFILLLPIPRVYTLRRSIKDRLAVSAMFFAGALKTPNASKKVKNISNMFVHYSAVVASGVRMKFVGKIGTSLDFTEIPLAERQINKTTANNADAVISGQIETTTALICASLPAWKKFFKYGIPKFKEKRLRKESLKGLDKQKAGKQPNLDDNHSSLHIIPLRVLSFLRFRSQNTDDGERGESRMIPIYFREGEGTFNINNIPLGSIDPHRGRGQGHGQGEQEQNRFSPRENSAPPYHQDKPLPELPTPS
ncbi:hypothetical protein EMCG_07570 [[Emmonsia] crescens]|uniref:Rhodopsin domain-containing protein n=1 Tax=[Emmonsia] crescens TaxID=73230 RepID=A0A0G2J5H1_9EURO|nr:hypothetical protein EMCG_07570 [Emmonsia crescens UAMH 3008]